MSYTYYLFHKPTGYKYYGYNEGSPENFWKDGGYFSSSQLVHYFIRRDGIESFEARIHKVFESWPRAKDFEGRFLRRIKAYTKKDWLNHRAGRRKFGYQNTDIVLNPPVLCPGCERPIRNFFNRFCTVKCSYKNKFHFKHKEK